MNNYHDIEIIDFLRYGWPISHTGSTGNKSKVNNWKGAEEYPDEVTNYLKNEIKHNSVLGPFDKNPFTEEACYSPLNTRAKKDCNERRIILDLSYPPGNSINDGIDKTKYLESDIELRFPTVDNLIKIVLRKGKNCLLFKRDLKRYYRQIFVDPSCIYLLGYTFGGHIYFDAALPMGLTSSAYIAQRVSSALIFAFQQKRFDAVNYIDDLGGAEVEGKANSAFETLGKILADIGILESKSKACSPAKQMLFLGILIDTENMTVSIDQSRLDQVKSLLDVWENKSEASLKETQSLVGVLSFCATCVREGRLFFSRILNFLKTLPKLGRKTIPNSVKLDVQWWSRFMTEYNGVTVIPSEVWTQPDEIFSSDACLTGGGAWTSTEYMHFVFPDSILKTGKYINQFELYSVLIALRTWKEQFENKNILIYCDNEPTVQILQSGRTACDFSQCCLREIRFHSAKHNFRLRAVHLAGEINRWSDALSRWHIHPKFSQLFLSETAHLSMKEVIPTNLELIEFW